LKHPTQPSKNATIDVQDFNPQIRQASAGVFKPLGRPDPIVVQDDRRWESGDLAIQTSTAAKRAEIDLLLDARVALLLQFPAVAEEDDRWIAHVGAHERSRIVPKKFTGPRVDTLGWQQVAAPSDSLEEWE
jgi:hypothetical protein